MSLSLFWPLSVGSTIVGMTKYRSVGLRGMFRITWPPNILAECQYLESGTRWIYSYNGRLIGNHMWPVDWHQYQWPWMISKDIRLLQGFSTGIFRTVVQSLTDFRQATRWRGLYGNDNQCLRPWKQPWDASCTSNALWVETICTPHAKGFSDANVASTNQSINQFIVTWQLESSNNKRVCESVSLCRYARQFDGRSETISDGLFSCSG